MTWFAESANETEATKEHCLMFLAVDFEFLTGHVRLWSGLGELAILGQSYLGVGDLGRISVPAENTSLTAERKTYQLSNVDPSWISETDIEGSFGRPVTEYFGFLNPTTRQLIGNPEINWEGRIDTPRRIDGANPIVEISAEHRHVLLGRTDGWRYTHEHQQEFFAGDKGFDQVPSLELKEILWGGKRVLPPLPRLPYPIPGLGGWNFPQV